MKLLKALYRTLPVAICSLAVMQAGAEKLVILHTNDTHSIIDPAYDTDLGGVVRRKAVIDSVRRADKNVMLIDAGDVVQGSLYFTLFEGEVEQKIMNALGYDIQILGNHEFDNGMEGLEKYLRGLNADLLSANYNFRNTNLKDLFIPVEIREYDSRRIGFIGINVNPEGLIDKNKIGATEYTDAIEAANLCADYLKKIEHCDMVIVISHIGYDDQKFGSDVDMARASRNIDVIIGGHSHTTVNPASAKSPAWRIPDAAGDTVLVTQTGRYGANIGEITIDLDNLKTDYKLIPINSRLDSSADSALVELIKPYKQPVDSIRSIRIGTANGDFPQYPQLTNWMADFVKGEAAHTAGIPVDLALVNRGGVRRPVMKGAITKGEIMEAFPFDNYMVILEMKGDRLRATFDSIAASKTPLTGVSSNVRVTVDTASNRAASVTVGGKPIDPDKTYRVATIDYLARGNDGFGPLREGKLLYTSKKLLYNDMIDAMESGWMRGRKQNPDAKERMTLAK